MFQLEYNNVIEILTTCTRIASTSLDNQEFECSYSFLYVRKKKLNPHSHISKRIVMGVLWDISPGSPTSRALTHVHVVCQDRNCFIEAEKRFLYNKKKLCYCIMSGFLQNPPNASMKKTCFVYNVFVCAIIASFRAAPLPPPSQHRPSRGGPTWSHGYSNAYPNFLTKNYICIVHRRYTIQEKTKIWDKRQCLVENTK
jgi:hypothetical protein